jgi:hypothetical protein
MQFLVSIVANWFKAAADYPSKPEATGRHMIWA